LLLVAASQLVWGLSDLRDRDRVAQRMPLSEITIAPAAQDAGTVVLVDWRVGDGARDEFVQRMRRVELVRRRTGARFWGLYGDPDRAGVLVETFRLGSWREHLTQHENRYTGDDLRILHEASSLADGDPVVHHLIEVAGRR
ncbi:MAG TPA: MFS transporter, partial [Pseudolysinimonas sp.]|nr:MFS transporter [Pseudolysinimonas sp.]